MEVGPTLQTSTNEIETTTTDKRTCVICLSDGSGHQVRVKGCGHQFCEDCIRKWASARRTPLCPLCNNRLSVIVLPDDSEQALEFGKANTEEEEADLACLDHSYFLQEINRLLRRTQSLQDSFYGAAFGYGKNGSERAEQSFMVLGEVIGSLMAERSKIEQEEPFDAGAVLQQLYDLDSVVGQVQNGTLDMSGAREAQSVRRYGADDADDLPDDEDDHYYEDMDDHVQYSRSVQTRGRRPSKPPTQKSRRRKN